MGKGLLRRQGSIPVNWSVIEMLIVGTVKLTLGFEWGTDYTVTWDTEQMWMRC